MFQKVNVIARLVKCHRGAELAKQFNEVKNELRNKETFNDQRPCLATGNLNFLLRDFAPSHVHSILHLKLSSLFIKFQFCNAVRLSVISSLGKVDIVLRYRNTIGALRTRVDYSIFL